MPATAPPLAAQARLAQLAGDTTGAQACLRRLITDLTGVAATEVTINADQYSLNSLNGTALLAGGDRYFFKFHSEEGEESTIIEYYNAELLRRHGYDVDVPVFACGEPGRQILLYALRTDARLADVCRSVELGEDRYEASAVIAAQTARDRRGLARMLESLHVATPAEVAAEPVHQLFWHRLTSPGAPAGFGGRVERFFVGRPTTLGGPGGQVTLDWAQLRDVHWVVNGIEYAHSLGELFAEAADRLDPAALAASGAVVAHGDEHNANVWFEEHDDGARLVSFDPAFAGRHLPSLLAEVKATFHNVYAHPLWLYEPALADARFTAAARLEGDRLVLDHDFAPSPLRLAFRDSKALNVWRPLALELAARGLLPSDWERVVRLALFCCPTLVLDLHAGAAGGHTPLTSAIGLGTAIAAGSAPVHGTDAFTALLAPTLAALAAAQSSGEPMPRGGYPPSRLVS